MFNYAGEFVGICIVRPGDFVYIRLIMLVHLLQRPGEFVYIRLIMLCFGRIRPAELQSQFVNPLLPPPRATRPAQQSDLALAKIPFACSQGTDRDWIESAVHVNRLGNASNLEAFRRSPCLLHLGVSFSFESNLT